MNHDHPVTNRLLTRYAPCLWLLIALAAAAPLWGPGMVNTRGGGDSPFLLQRVLDMAESLRSGIFPVRWMAHAAYDLGYPFFNYYAALPYYLAGALNALGLDPLLALQATQTLGFVAAALAAGLWARRLYPANEGAVLLMVTAYTFAPFHMVNVYVRGDSLSEFYAFVWYPLILWSVERAVARPGRRTLLLAALSYGALVLTHNVSALIFSPFAGVYALSAAWRAHSTELRHATPAQWARWLVELAAPFVLGVLLTAWFWLPALSETHYGQMGADFTAGYFHYSRHFRGLNLTQLTPAFDYSVATRVEEAGPFAMGLAQTVLALLGAGWLAMRRGPGAMPWRDRLFLLGSGMLATLMLTPLSRLLWERLPLLGLTQFPWRFLSVQALFTAALTGALAVLPRREWGRAIAALGCAALSVAALAGLRPDRLRITAADVTWENLLLYEAFTGNIGATIRYEYLPRDVLPRLYTSESVVEGNLRPLADGGALQQATLERRMPIEQVWRVELADAAAVAFPLNAWPGWRAWVDGQPVASYPMPGSGRLALDLGAGAHTVRLRLGRTPLRAAAESLSLLTVLLGGAGWAWVASRAGTAWRLRRPGAGWRYGLAAMALSLVAPAMMQVLPALNNAAPARAAFFDFAQIPYPHAGPLHFANLILESAGPLPATLAPGATLTVPLRFRATAPLTATLSLVSPAEPRHGVPYALATTTLALDCLGADACDLAPTLTAPADLTRGLYLVQLRVFGASGEQFAQVGAGGMSALYVGAVRTPLGMVRRLDAPVLAAFRDLTLHSLEARQPNSTTLRLTFGWSLATETPRTWSLSLRLLDAAGDPVLDAGGAPVQRDLQPGYGYLPTTLWRPGEWIADIAELPLPPGLPPGEYRLRVLTYLMLATGALEGGGSADVPLTLERATPCGAACQAQTPLCASGGLRLLGVALPPAWDEGQPLSFYAEWSVADRVRSDVFARWDLLDASGAAVATADGPLQRGSHVSDWPEQTWARTAVRIETPPHLPAAPYRLRLTLRGLADSIACDLDLALPLRPRARFFAAPELPHPQNAVFSDTLRLLGYESVMEQERLHLTLWWQAQQAPGRDYKRFIHVYAPATEQMVAQDDAMPRGWSYPTSWWLSGEVVSETVTLDLSGAAPGEYRVAVGWYAPETLVRLPARAADGAALPADRAVLDSPVTRR